MNAQTGTGRLAAIVNMLGSEHEGERGNAAAMVARMASTARKPVADLLREALGVAASPGNPGELAMLRAANDRLGSALRAAEARMSAMANETAAANRVANHARELDRSRVAEIERLTALVNRMERAATAQPAPAGDHAQPCPARPGSDQDNCRWLRDNADLNGWERGFVGDVLRRNRWPLSEPQQRVVARMFEKYPRAHAAQPARPAQPDAAEAERVARNAAMQERMRREREAATGRDYAAEARATAQANRPRQGDACPF